MEKFAKVIVKHKKLVIVLFLIATVICALMFTMVRVNYNMVDYLPPSAQSTKALEIMNEEFTQAMPNASVMVKDVSIEEGVAYKQKILALEGVSEVMWLDDVMDIKTPLEMSDKKTIEGFYKDGNALYSVVITKGTEKETTESIRDLIGDKGAISGEAPDIQFVQSGTGKEVLNAVIILVPIIILILVLSSTSWIEPLLFLAAIGVSIIINMGTNAFSGEVSFLTNSVTPILQLAVSLDYAIFLLHSFADNRKKYPDIEEAMCQSIKESFSTISASASTTLFGFLALLFMDFRIGADLGLSLAKGIVFSFVSVIIFLPALTLCVYKVIDKTRHREFMPGFKNINKILSKFAIPIIIFVIILIVPCFLGQSQTEFLYGYQPNSESRSGQDIEAIENAFGKSNAAVLLVPRGDVAKEESLCHELKKLNYVTSVVAYANQVGSAIPPEFLDESITGQFYSKNYARIIVYTNTSNEGNVAFNAVEEIQGMAESFYGDKGVYSAGQSVNLYDMKTVVQKDNTRTNVLAIISIFFVLLVTFKSASLPFFLLLTIETAIWINLSIPYFMGTSINYIGYLVLNTVQLGATVDYAILLTVTYMRYRQTMPKKEAIHQSMGNSFKSILVSGTTLATAGFTLAATSSNPIISDIGMLLGRGTILSMLMVVVFLPAILTLFDSLIGKTTYKSRFFTEPNIKKN